MTEKLKLVTSFSQLKAGDLVVVKPCGWCEGQHRGMLMHLEDCIGRYSSGRTNKVKAWVVAPAGKCSAVAFAASAVRARIVYLVDTGLEQSQSTERRKELAR